MPVRLRRLRALLLVSLAFEAGAWPQTESKQESLGQVFVYANWEYPEGKWVDIACDDEIVAKVKAGRFFVMNLSPGRHAVSARDGMPAFIEVRSGEKSFLRLGREIDGQTVMRVFNKMFPPEAGKELVHLAYIDAEKAISNSVPKEAPRNLRQPQLKTRGDKE